MKTVDEKMQLEVETLVAKWKDTLLDELERVVKVSPQPANGNGDGANSNPWKGGCPMLDKDIRGRYMAAVAKAEFSFSDIREKIRNLLDRSFTPPTFKWLDISYSLSMLRVGDSIVVMPDNEKTLATELALLKPRIFDKHEMVLTCPESYRALKPWIVTRIK